MATVKPPSRFATQDLTTRYKPISSTSRDSTPLSSHVEWRRRTWDTEVDDAVKTAPFFLEKQEVHDVNIYTKSVARSVVSRGECSFFTYLKNLNSHKIRKNQWMAKSAPWNTKSSTFFPWTSTFPFQKRCFMRYFESTPQSTTWFFLTPKEKTITPLLLH